MTWGRAGLTLRRPALCGPPLNEVRSGIKTDTERKGERGEGGGLMEAMTAHWKGRGDRQERSLHIQVAHFLTNYCKTSLSPCF